MSPDGSLQTVESHTDTAWHSIRPWAPILSLTVREITSVSATFILSSNLSETDPSLALLGLEAAEEDPEQGEGDKRKGSSIIADALTKGLSVNVNGSAWPRAFIRIDDQLDEAVIIIYALMPGRQYDIELGLAESDTLRRQVTTQEDSDDDSAEINTDPESPSLDNQFASESSLSDPHSTPSTSPSRTVPGTPPTTIAANPPISFEEHLRQVQHTLSMVNAEREALLTSLKSARRDAQKADSALRSEIDTLKRTSEKNTATELRARQKVLALQEAVKRAQNATKETEDQAKDVQSEIPDLKARKEEKERQHRRVKAEADKVRKEREEIEECDRKRLEAMRSELAGLTNKLERLGGKKEKMESTLIPELEDKLRETEAEIEAEEDELANLEMEERVRAQLEETYVPSQRIRHNSAGPIGRPNPVPIQRPFGDSNPPWSTATGTRPATHNPRSQSFHSHGSVKHQANSSPPILLMNPQRRSSLKSSNLTSPSVSALLSSSNSTSTSTTPSSPTSSSPAPASPGAIAATSTLSSRAPAFEPARPIGGLKINIGNGYNSTTFSAAPAPAPAVNHTHRSSASSGTNGTASATPVGAGRPGRSGSHGQRSGYGHGSGH